MLFRDPIPFPALSANPTPFEYIWFQLPYAVPPLITFFVGMLLFAAGLIRMIRGGRRWYYLSFSITVLGLASLGLLLALRSLILDKELLLALNSSVYPAVMISAPAAYLLVYHAMDSRYRGLLYLAYLSGIATLVGIAGILYDGGFTGEWLTYSFGKYPIAGPLLMPWGVVAAAGYLFYAVPLQIRHFRKHHPADRAWLFIGLNLLFIAVISNLPTFVGIPLYPGSGFSFIPMLILAYGVFRSDFLDLNDLLFKKNLMFFFLNLLIGAVFLGLATTGILFLSPADFVGLNWFPWLSAPMLSVAMAFGLGILIGSANPERPLNQFGALSLYIYGFQIVPLISLGIGIAPLIALRAHQLCFLIVCLAPSVHLRFAYLAMGLPLPRLTPVIDFATLVLCSLVLTPYLFVGYFDYTFGRIGATGPVVGLMGAVGLGVLAIIARDWWRTRATRADRLGDFVVLCLVGNGIFLLLNIPATSGIAFYPTANLGVITTGILAFAVLKYGRDAVPLQALKVSRRVSLISFLLVLVILFYFFPFLKDQAPLPEVLLHLILFGMPLLLLSYQFSFLLTRPITRQLDRTYDSLAESREQAEAALKEAEVLAELARRANEGSDLSNILALIGEVSAERIGGHTLALYVYDEADNRLLCRAVYTDGQIRPNSDFPLPLRSISVVPESGTLFRTFGRGRPLYMSLDRIRAVLPEVDRRIVETFSFNWFVQQPVVVEKRTVGILIVGGNGPLALTGEQKNFLTRMTDQVAGAVQAAALLDKVREEQQRTEQANAESRIMAELAREAIQTQDLGVVMETFSLTLRERFPDVMTGLWVVDESRNALICRAGYLDSGLRTTRGDLPDAVMEIPLNESGGSMYQTFRRGKTLYMRHTRPELINRFEADREIQNYWSFAWIIQIPLAVRDRVIGILHVVGGDKSSRIDRRDLPFLERLADQVTGAVQAAALFDRVREEQERTDLARAEAEILAELARRANEGQDLDEILSVVFDIARERIGATGLALYMCDEVRSALALRSMIHRGEHVGPGYFPESVRELPLRPESGTQFRTYQRRKTLVIPFIDPKFNLSESDRAILGSAGFEWVVEVPLISEDRVIGILNFAGYERIRIKPADREFLDRVCYQVTGAVQATALLEATERARGESDRLLTSILPRETAEELKRGGAVEPQHYENVTVLFTDFVGFTAATEKMKPDELVRELDGCFSQFDAVIERNGLEKLKTIGDAYMCAGGLPKKNDTHAIDACLTALEFRAFMNQMAEVKVALETDFWQIRIGIHTGPVTAGVIGTKKFAYDIWGDTVNTASRMESSGSPERINISADTYALVKDFFDVVPRGKIAAKGKGEMEMYFLERIKPELSADEMGLAPNAKFELMRMGDDGLAGRMDRAADREGW